MAVIIATPSFVGTEQMLAAALASTLLLLLVALRSFLTCCHKPNKEEVHTDNTKMVVTSPVETNTLPTASNQSLSSTIHSKDFFHDIEMATFSPVRKQTCRGASLSDVSAPGSICVKSQSIFKVKPNIYQNVPSKNLFSSALPLRPQTTLPVYGSVFDFADTTLGHQIAQYDGSDAVNSPQAVPAVNEPCDLIATYRNLLTAVHGGLRYNRDRY